MDETAKKFIVTEDFTVQVSLFVHIPSIRRMYCTYLQKNWTSGRQSTSAFAQHPQAMVLHCSNIQSPRQTVGFTPKNLCLKKELQPSLNYIWKWSYTRNPANWLTLWLFICSIFKHRRTLSVVIGSAPKVSPWGLQHINCKYCTETICLKNIKWVSLSKFLH